MWDDWRNDSHDIYAQRIDSLGQVLWQENGVYVCTAADTSAKSIFIKAVSDERNGVILSWCPRDTPEDENIYAQRVDSLGVCQWDSNGMPVCTALHMQILSSICSDGEGGAIVSWADGRNDNVYVQRVGDVEGVEETEISDFGFRNSELKVHPNPFSKKTVIEFRSSGVQESNSQLHNSSTPQLTIYDVSGRLVRTLVKEFQGSRVQRVEWNGMDDNGKEVKSGIYYIRVKTQRQNFITKVVKINCNK